MEFIGYWGCGRERELDDLLKSIKKSHQNLEIFRKMTKHSLNPVWNVAYLGCDRHYIPAFSENCTFQITDLQLDAWVSIKDDRYLILGREPFGRVPLYWMQLKQTIWFASHLQLLLPLVENPQVSVRGLYGYTCFSYVPTPLTPITGVFTVPAGTEMIWKCDREQVTFIERRLRSWREAEEQIQDEATAINDLQKLLKNAIERQIADLKEEPVGVFLSGGLDSSVVAAMLVRAGVKVRAYTLDFGNAGIPEHPYATRVAEYLNIPLVKVEATPRYIQKAIIPTIQALDLPFGDGVTVPLYLLLKRASEETQTIFNGEGGDQLFAGWTNKPLIAAALYQEQHPGGQETFTQQYLRTFHRLWSYEERTYNSEIYSNIQNLRAEDWLEEALDPTYTKSLLHRLRRATLMLKGAQNIQPRATALGFAWGLKVRSPFCDLPLAQWTFHLSGELTLQGACEKYILKRAVENWLPPEIVWRQKRGMGVPLTSWCFNELWHQIGIWLNPGILTAENRFNPQIAAQIVSGEFGGAIADRRIGEILWLLIIWQLWRIHVLGEKPGKKEFIHPFLLPSSLNRQYRKFKTFLC